MKYILKFLMIMVLAMCTATTYAQELTIKQVGQYMSVAAAVLSMQKMVAGVDEVCHSKATNLSKNWQSKNHTAVLKAEKLRKIAFKVVENHEGMNSVNALRKKQDDFLAKKVAELINEIDSMASMKKLQACQNLQQKIEGGGMDIKSNKKLYSFLMSQ